MDKPWKVIFAFVGVFIAGAVFGGLLALRIGKAVADRRGDQLPFPPPQARSQPPGQPGPGQPPPQPQPPQPVAPQAQSAQLLRRFAERLDLTPEQRDRIMPMIQRATGDFRRQQQVHFREDTITLQHLQEDIRRELTPAQRTKLDKMEERQRQLIEQRQRDEQMQRGDQMPRGEPGMMPANQRPNPNNPGFNPNPAFNPNAGPNQRGPNQPPRPGQPGPGQPRPFQGQPGPNQPGPNPPGQFQPGGPPNGPVPQGQQNFPPPSQQQPKGPPPAGGDPK